MVVSRSLVVRGAAVARAEGRQTPGPPLFHWLGLEGHCEGGPKRAALREALNRRGRK